VSKFCLTILKSVEEDEQMAADFASEEEYGLPLYTVHLLDICRVDHCLESRQLTTELSTNRHAERIRKKVETVRKLMIIMKKLRSVPTTALSFFVAMS
jgi:hypothetical protein